MKEVSDALLKNVKTTLQVTWDSEDDSIKDFILQGAAFIEAKAGPLNFDGTTNASRLGQRLLREYVRYDWNGYGSSFEKDFLSDILNLQLVNAVEMRNGNA